jgi:hypothetical protein
MEEHAKESETETVALQDCVLSKSQKRRQRRKKIAALERDPVLKAKAEARAAEQARCLYFEAEIRRETEALLRREAEDEEAKCLREIRRKSGCNCCDRYRNDPLGRVASQKAKDTLLAARAAWATRAAEAEAQAAAGISGISGISGMHT